MNASDKAAYLKLIEKFPLENKNHIAKFAKRFALSPNSFFTKEVQ